MSYFRVECIGKRTHNKRSGAKLIREENCGMLLGWVEIESTTDVTNISYCKNCKRLVKVRIKDGGDDINISLLPKDTILETTDRSFTTDEY